MKRLVVVLENGSLTHIYSDEPLEVVQIDYDVNGGDEADMVDVPQGNGNTEKAFVYRYVRGAFPEAVEKAFAL